MCETKNACLRRDSGAAGGSTAPVMTTDSERKALFTSAIVVKKKIWVRNDTRVAALKYLSCKNCRGVTLVPPLHAPASSFFS
jgi:hypothetical protein